MKELFNIHYSFFINYKFSLLYSFCSAIGINGLLQSKDGNTTYANLTITAYAGATLTAQDLADNSTITGSLYFYI